jgi:pimeloyl-ACP methyl ester carboxylesterase
MDDVPGVMDAAGSGRAAIVGYSDGGLMAALFAATYPARTDALILWDTYATPALDGEDKPDGEHWLTFRRLALDVLDHWGEGRFLYAVAPTVAANPGAERPPHAVGAAADPLAFYDLRKAGKLPHGEGS